MLLQRPYNSFEIAQAQFDRVAALIGLDEATARRRETPRMIHAVCEAGLSVRVDGRHGRGLVLPSRGEACHA